MTHPDDLLADYVDGTLSGEDLRRVERHLSSCERCRSEVALAGGARTALATLVEPDVPARVGDRAIDEAARGAGTGTVIGIGGRTTPPAWYRWAIGAAAAAAILIAVLALPRLGNEPGAQRAAGSAESAVDRPARSADRVEIEHRNYDAGDVTDLALSYRSTTSAPAMPQSSAVDATSGQEGAGVQNAFSRELTPDAVSCLSSAVPDAGGELVRLIRARFEGTPAYLGVYLEGPGAGQPADSVHIWVVSVRDCSILTYSSASI
jgi:hypothetical protein